MARQVGVLVVDDQNSIRELLKLILTSMGAVILGEADNGLDAVEKYKQLSPDMVLMDINMPKMDGVQALKNIIAHDPKALVIMVTTQNTLATVKECLTLGARNYILKDCSQTEIIQNLKNTWVEYIKQLQEDN
jgi:two-component system chemotaxis response regulator CheY